MFSFIIGKRLNQIMVTPKHITVFKSSINGLTLYKPESLAETKVSFLVEIIYHCDLYFTI